MQLSCLLFLEGGLLDPLPLKLGEMLSFLDPNDAHKTVLFVYIFDLRGHFEIVELDVLVFELLENGPQFFGDWQVVVELSIGEHLKVLLGRRWFLKLARSVLDPVPHHLLLIETHHYSLDV